VFRRASTAGRERPKPRKGQVGFESGHQPPARLGPSWYRPLSSQ